MPRRKCKSTTKAGKPCGAPPITDTHDGVLDPNQCMGHQSKEAKEKFRFGGAQEGAGRKPNPRAIDVLRERLEERIDEVLDPLFDATKATRTISDGDGGTIELTDHQIRIVAIRELLDRAYGKPKQQTELSGEVKTTQSVDTSNLTDEELDQFEKLLKKAAGNG